MSDFMAERGDVPDSASAKSKKGRQCADLSFHFGASTSVVAGWIALNRQGFG
jgi:hypothetical protein